MIDIIFDMETADPDDMLTLCLLVGHSKVNLRAVTVTPGSKAQIGLVKHILKRLNCPDLPVGARNNEHPKECVSEFHYKWLGKIEEAKAPSATEVLFESYKQFPETVLLTGAALHNPYAFLTSQESSIPLWVGQGGFAGEGVVPTEDQLEKFKGKKTCPTFNFNGCVDGAKYLLQTEQIKKRLLVSKNVCHGVIYDQAMHEIIEPHKNDNVGMSLIYQGMSVYLSKNRDGKAFHDPLAACVAINPEVCEFKEVELYREKGEWGSFLKNETNTFISTKVNFSKFVETLIGSNG